ncbi:MAG: hypothetical protein ABJD38_07065 [Aurantimonas coralicida]
MTNQKLLDAARERARPTIETSRAERAERVEAAIPVGGRAQRQQDMEGWTSAGELADRITAAVDEARRGPGMTVEQALAMIEGFNEARH